MTTFKLALRNLMGAGLRTWLNVFILALVYIMMIFFKGMINGWDQGSKNEMIKWEYAGGQYWHSNYDPYDPFTLTESHAVISANMNAEIEKGNITPVLIVQGTVYPEGRIQPAMLKGADPNQKIVSLPTQYLVAEGDEIPVIIGSGMAKNCNLKVGDAVVIRWRDVNGTFDATEVEIKAIFDTDVFSVDNGVVWLPINTLQKLVAMDNEASMFIQNSEYEGLVEDENYIYKDIKFLTADFDKVIAAKTMGGSVFSFILLLLAMLAIFDTQVLSIFRRQKEIGMFVALGMTRGEVVRMFTVEGAMNAFLALIMAGVLGTPLFLSQLKNGIYYGDASDGMGIVIADTLYPAYGFGLVISTVLIVFITTTIVSYLPARKISKMNPTDALRGKLQ